MRERRFGERRFEQGSKLPYEGKRLCDREPLSPEQVFDIFELNSGRGLSRHEWLQELLESTPLGENYSQTDVLRAMLARMAELTSEEERDLELEAATVEMGFRFTSSTDIDGNPFSFHWVRATESFEAVSKTRHMDSVRTREMEPSDIVGIGHIYAFYEFGGNIGYTGANADRWFISYRAEGVTVDVPFDAITEVVEGEEGVGSIIESPTDRTGPFHGWRLREAA